MKGGPLPKHDFRLSTSVAISLLRPSLTESPPSKKKRLPDGSDRAAEALEEGAAATDSTHRRQPREARADEPQAAQLQGSRSLPSGVQELRCPARDVDA